MTLNTNIVLIGFMGTGKSVIGRALARRTEARLLDTDAEIERAASKSVPQIFADEGEAAFRARETALLSSLVPFLTPPSFLGKGVGGLGPLILSTGGGTPLRPENGPLLKQIGTVVWLSAPPEAILARVRRSLPRRPLLAGYAGDPLGRIRSLLAEREACYAALADFQLETSACAHPEEAADRILALLAPTQST